MSPWVMFGQCACYRALVGAERWQILLTCVALMCRNMAQQQNSWSAVDCRLGAIATARRSRQRDLVDALLHDLAKPNVRRSAIDSARAMAIALPEKELRRITADAARLVEHSLPDQAFSFRVAMTLISILVTEAD